MSCENLAGKISEHAMSLPHEHPAKIPLAQLAMDIALECTPYRRSHTSSILASLSGQDPNIPNFLKKHPEKQQILIENGILDSSIV